MSLPPTVRRIGHIEDQETTIIGLRTMLSDTTDLALVASAQSVDALLSRNDDLDLVVLDLRLPDGSSPRANVEQLHRRGIEVVIYTGGDDPRLMRSAAQAGVLGILLKSWPAHRTVDAIRTAAGGEPVMSLDWAVAIDGDPDLMSIGLSPIELRVLERYASGENVAGVAKRLALSEADVHTHLRAVRTKYAARR